MVRLTSRSERLARLLASSHSHRLAAGFPAEGRLAQKDSSRLPEANSTLPRRADLCDITASPPRRKVDWLGVGNLGSALWTH
jgi:hypothetical protein